MVRIGIIGLGRAWEESYEPAIRRLDRRVQVAAVYDHVHRRAEQFCRRCPRARAIDGVIALIDAPHVDAILLLDSNWHGRALLHYACARRKPIHLAGDLGDDTAFIEHLHATSVLTGTTVMPELSWRYTPATTRLQELLATRLGPPRTVHIRIDVRPPDVDRVLPRAVDWCRYVCGARPVSVTSEESQPSHRTVTLTLETSSGRTSAARIEIARASDQATIPSALYRLECHQGSVEIETPTQLRWQSATASAVDECLSNDRSSHEVMLDHFCRRAVGGLIPVADLRDVHDSLTVLNAAGQSLKSGRPVEVLHLEE